MTENITHDHAFAEADGRHPMLALLESYDQKQSALRRGDIVSGHIAQIGSNEILIDVGWKFEGVLSHQEYGRMPKDEIAAFKVGDSVECMVVNPEDRQGNLVLSIAQARTGQDWENADSAHTSGEVFEANVDGHNKGGLIVYFGMVRGFVPASQIDRQHGIRREDIDGSPNSPLARFVGKPIRLKVIEIDRQKNRLILSELAAMREHRKHSKLELLDQLQEGQIREGVVTSLADFGAFVDIGGADGLVHLSELDWNRVNHPREVLELGQKVRVKVISVDRERKRIGLSMKQLQPEPWSRVDDQYQVGEIVPATVTRLADFGAFARLESGIEGLIHVSELSDEAVSPEAVVSPGDRINVRVIRVDPDRKRIGLSLKRADAAYDALVDDGVVLDDVDDDAWASVTTPAAATPAAEPPPAEAPAEASDAPAEAPAEAPGEPEDASSAASPNEDEPSA